MSNLTVRILSAAVMLIVGLSALSWNPLTRWIFSTLIFSVGAWEFARMIDVKFALPRKAPMALFAGFWVAILGLWVYPVAQGTHLLPGDPNLWLWFWLIAGLMIYTLAGFRHLPIETLAPWLFMSLFGLLYLGPWALGVHHLYRTYGGWSGIAPLVTAFAGIALSDTGAYATGRLFGKRKLCPQISAKKTIEGAIGGTFIGSASCTAFAVGLLHLPLARAALLGVLISLSSIVGDLFISILKRYTGTKDASQIIPGHGGVLDRFDSLIFTGPIAAFLMRLLGA